MSRHNDRVPVKKENAPSATAHSAPTAMPAMPAVLRPLELRPVHCNMVSRRPLEALKSRSRTDREHRCKTGWPSHLEAAPFWTTGVAVTVEMLLPASLCSAAHVHVNHGPSHAQWQRNPRTRTSAPRLLYSGSVINVLALAQREGAKEARRAGKGQRDRPCTVLR